MEHECHLDSLCKREGAVHFVEDVEIVMKNIMILITFTRQE